jgi:hypothetical protein
LQSADLHLHLRSWTGAHPGVFVVEETRGGARLTEVATAKSLLIEAGSVQSIEPRANTTTGNTYLVVQRPGFPPLALADAGFAFGLDPRSTGPLPPTAPPVLSFGDFARLLQHLRHVAPDAARRREALDVMTILIAGLDGAQAVGLDTAAEEAQLEPVLRQLESGA